MQHTQNRKRGEDIFGLLVLQTKVYCVRVGKRRGVYPSLSRLNISNSSLIPTVVTKLISTEIPGSKLTLLRSSSFVYSLRFVDVR